MKNLSEKYTYLWTILVGIPFGIGLLIAAINYFKTIPKEIGALGIISGRIENYEEKEFYDRDIDTHYDVFYIKIGNQTLNTEIGEKRKILRDIIPSAYQDFSEVIVWYDKKTFSIEQIMLDGHSYIKFKPPFWKVWFFFILGMIFTGMGTIYLIKYYKSTWRTIPPNDKMS